MRRERELNTWQEYLARLIADPREKQRLEREVRIQSVTFHRWITGKSRPREENMRQLLRSIPAEHYTSFHHLIVQEFPGLEEEASSPGHDLLTFPREFYAQVLSAHANTPPALFKQTLFDLILQQALEQFDPDRQGMSLSLACCVWPRPEKKVRSLRQVSGIGTPPWRRDDILKSLFLGSESLAGAAVTRYRRQVVNSRGEVTFTPIHWTEHEESAGAFPIARQARIAGCLIASSAHPFYFTDERQELLECYASLLALAFEQEDFFDPGTIVLGPMPLYSEQEPYFHNFGKLVSQKFVDAQAAHQQINIYEARQKVWQDIEEEMLHVVMHRT